MLKVGIVGLGLIGGSILKGLAQFDYEIYAISKSSAQSAKTWCTFSSDILEDVENCDIIFACSPMRKTPKILEKLEKIVKKDTIVCDVCSLKGFLDKKYNFNYIGTHPMAGTENSGFDSSFDGLFKGAKWVISKKNDVLEEIIKTLGAKPILMNSKEHDLAAAQISHLPMLISFALFHSTKTNEAKTLASSGFRDTTRLSMTNEILACDMLELNAQNIDKCLDEFISSINYLKNLSADEKIEVLKNLAQKRAELYDKNGKNCFGDK